jgi:hypothetical protein
MESRRVFSEQEVAEILKRAVVIAENQSATYTPGITLAEVERIAAEAGVPVAAVRQALAEREGTAPRSDSETRPGAAIERVVDGELAPEDYDVVLDGLRSLRQAGHGQTAQVGKTLQARVWHGGAPTSVQLTSRKGRTRLVVQPQVWFSAFLALYPVFVFSIVAAGSLGEAGQGLLAGLIVVVTTAIGIVVATALARRAQRKAIELAGRLTAKLEEHLETVAAEFEATATHAPDAASAETEALRQRF